jgi:phosphoribosylformimino-5-aminoimidazole carboxamide ribotide isomerase
MDVIPSIDIKDGRCVRLYQGDYERVTVFSDDPAEVARRWENEGARLIHVVDLDGANLGMPANTETVRNLIRAVDIPVQVSGGVRSVDSARSIFDQGATRIVIGTAAIEEPTLVDELCASWPHRIAVGIDALAGVVMTRGWKRNSSVAVSDLAPRMVACGASWIIYTDIERDGTLTEPNYGATADLISAVPVPVIASGGVATVEHVRRLREIGVAGVIIGRALYTGAVDLAEAIAVAE